MFKFWGKKKIDKQIKKSVTDFDTSRNTDLDDIWSIADINKLIIAMIERVSRKSNYGDDIKKLSDAERIFYINTQLEAEVNNGGFSQFVINSSGNYANEIIHSLNAIGANQTAKICSKALLSLGCELPANWSERQNLLEKILTDDVEALLNDCDNEFYQYPDNLDELNYQFIIKNKEQFT